MTCKGICLRHRMPKPIQSGRYAGGQKRCQGCEIFINWDVLITVIPIGEELVSHTENPDRVSYERIVVTVLPR